MASAAIRLAFVITRPVHDMAMPPDGTSLKALKISRAKVNAQVVEGKPTFFRLEAPLPQQGRTDTPMAASDKMWVVLKTYAADGENDQRRHNLGRTAWIAAVRGTPSRRPTGCGARR